MEDDIKFKKNTIFEKDKELLAHIQKILDTLCETNSDFANIIISDLNNESVEKITITKTPDGLIKVDFIVMTPNIRDYAGNQVKKYKCTLQINDMGFEYTKEEVSKSNCKDSDFYAHILSCKKMLIPLYFIKKNFMNTNQLGLIGFLTEE